MAIFKLKKFSKSSLEDDYKDWKKSYDSGNRKESSAKAKKWMNRWTKEVYYPNKKKGILVDPDREIVNDASGHTPPKGIMLKKKKFSGELSRTNNDTTSLKRKLFFLDEQGNVVTAAEIKAKKAGMGKGATAKDAFSSIKTENTAASTMADSIKKETSALNKSANAEFSKLGKSGNKTGIEALKSSNGTKGAFNAGSKSTGIMGGLKNTWKSGAKGKAGIIAGGVALLGAGALLGRKKDD